MSEIIVGRKALQKAAGCLILLGILCAQPALGAAGPPPVILVQPVSTTVPLLGTATFSVTASSGTTMYYQWYQNGNAISGATSSSYTNQSVQASSAGTYTVRVTNAGGSIGSAGATLTVLVPPGIATQPQSQGVVAGQSAGFSVVANGTSPFGYQWMFNGVALSGATDSALTFSNAQPFNAGNYAVSVSNVTGSITSAVAVLNVYSLDGVTTAATNGGVLSWFHTVGKGNNRLLLVTTAHHNGNKVVTGVSYGGISLTLAGRTNAGSANGASIWYLVAPPPGTASVVVTLSGGVPIVAGAASFAGVHQTTPLGAFAGAWAQDQFPTVNSPAAPGDLMIDVLAAEGDALGATPAVGETQLWKLQTGASSGDIIGGGCAKPGANSATQSWTLQVAQPWALGAVALKSSASAPVASTLVASNITVTSATLNALVNPQTSATTWYFQYGVSTNYGSLSGSSTIPAGAGPVPVSLSVTGLANGMIYHYSIVASNAAGIAIGQDMTFNTQPGAPSGSTLSASNVTASSAVLNAVVNQQVIELTCYFQYGTTTNYGLVSPAQILPALGGILDVLGPVPVSIPIAGLTPGTIYHYRLVVTALTGTTYGQDASFATLSLPPIQITNGLTPVATGATPNMQLTLTSAPGASFTVLTSHRLDIPLARWVILGTMTETSPGQYAFTDPQPATNRSRFYSIRSP